MRISPQVLESPARTFMLDEQETMHLYTLAKQTPPVSFPICNDTATPMLQYVLNNLTFSPETVLDARMNVIAWNRATTTILLDYSKISVSKRNLLRIMLTNEKYKK